MRALPHAAVRYGRVPKRPREPVGHSAETHPDLTRNPTAGGAPAPPAADDMDQEPTRHDMNKELVKLVTTAHRCNNTYTEELKATLQHRTIMLKVEDSDNEASGGEEAASSTTDRATDVRSVLWYNVALRMTPAVQQVVEFAKRLPGFHGLPQDDQLILIKLGFFEIWLTRVSRISTSDCVVFDDGTAISHSQLAIIYDAPFATAILTYVWNIIKMQLTEEEMAVFTGTLLMCPQRNALSDPDRISQLQRALNDALHTDVMSGVSPEGTAIARSRLEAFAAARNEVRVLGSRHHQLLSWCREHWPRLLLPALFSEIFDIPKMDEDEPPDTERASTSMSQI